MDHYFFRPLGLLALPFTLFVLHGCGQGSTREHNQEADQQKPKGTVIPSAKRTISQPFKDYWYAGEAELSSYKLEQARYGELRDGHAVLIYVTEPFRPGTQVKADQEQADNVQVLKLNSTKKFLTGIYPYSIMTSTFYPVYQKQHALKLSTTVQEWCGHVYTQLNNRENFEVVSHSYFETEGDQEMRLDKAPLEDEVWTQLRLAPEELPTGSLNMLPSLEYLRLGHQQIKAYQVTASLLKNGPLTTYELHYPQLGRRLKIQFQTAFPHLVEHWEETYKSGFGANAQTLTTSASRMKTLKTPYWQKNGNKDVILRDSLGI